MLQDVECMTASPFEITRLEWDKARWETLRNRLADELARGTSMLRIALDTKPVDYGNARAWRQGNNVESWQASIEAWAKDGAKFREPGRNFKEPPLAQKIETALEDYFARLDSETTGNPVSHGFLSTSVSVRIMEKIHKARALTELIEIPSPPGHGKTSAKAEYQAKCRKSEGFDAPVWVVTLRETNITLKNILHEIALAMHASGSLHGTPLPDGEKDIDALDRAIERSAESSPGGVLILDEAQHIGYFNGMARPSGMNIINGLRSFVDRGLFGIALLSNGEIYRRASAGKEKSAQIASRITCEKPIRLTDDDILLFMAAWGVSGKPEREWCIKTAMEEGGLRNLAKAFKDVRYEYGSITHAGLMSYRKA